MTGAKCQRCGHYWAFTGNSTLFAVIGRICPDCIPRALPVMGDDPAPLLPRKTVLAHAS